MPKQQIKKYIGVPFEKESSYNEAGHLIKRGFFTSDKKDEFGDIITKAGTERALEAYRQWGNIRYMHQPRPVGKVIGIGRADGLKWNEVEFAVIDKDAAFEVEQGLLSAMSVGILANWDDLEFMDDGGFKILDYQLAEISLVDHPANYDAVLKGIPATEGLRYLAQQYGFNTVAREMASLLNTYTEGNMPKKDKAIESEVIEEEVIETEDAEEAPEEEPIEEEKDITAEAEVDAEAEVEDEVEVEKDLPETEEVIEAEAEVAEEVEEEISIEASITQAFTDGFEKLFSVLSEQNAKLDLLLTSLETAAEDQGTDQSDGDDVEVEAEADVERSLDGEEDETTVPVSRDGHIEATDLTMTEEGEPVPASRTLEEALHKFFGVNVEQ